ncbi:unnamed protein product [Eruca vesicaria subsp. sativa]|uniref:Uncharacterized protein n=1 Tax=Eruca vesicaria subsp. sativa TaxID=29727 RepID=A0ABC8JJH1_ERUVS|nr:unnamed protein product [Eruca vesicaria subsp. sativa]
MRLEIVQNDVVVLLQREIPDSINIQVAKWVLGLQRIVITAVYISNKNHFFLHHSTSVEHLSAERFLAELLYPSRPPTSSVTELYKLHSTAPPPLLLPQTVITEL